ncbi:MAG: sulfurtransferase TusA family protein [Armatimonadetes bacterium]|nr:sulfurtransferase TusA family protein [Armatimonadota bacterium]MDW8153291.1 sulfurtransferase TusA family protein [Armatimonadota bacterium]
MRTDIPEKAAPEAERPADAVLDCRGLLCPLPLLKTQEALRGLHVGQVLEVLATDPQAEADLRNWAHLAGHEVEPLGRQDGIYRFRIRRMR